MTSHHGYLAHAGFPSIYLPLPSSSLLLSPYLPTLTLSPPSFFPFKSLSSLRFSSLAPPPISLFPDFLFHSGISFPPLYPSLCRRYPSALPIAAAAAAVATTPASPTLPNGVVLPLPLRNLQPARSPAATGRDCWAFPSRSRSLSTRIPYIPRLLRPLSLHRTTGIYLATFCSHLCPFPSLIGFSPSLPYFLLSRFPPPPLSLSLSDVFDGE